MRDLSRRMKRTLAALMSVAVIISGIPSIGAMASELDDIDEIVTEVESSAEYDAVSTIEETSEVFSEESSEETSESVEEVTTTTEAEEINLQAEEAVVEKTRYTVSYAEGKEPSTTSANKKYVYPVEMFVKLSTGIDIIKGTVSDSGAVVFDANLSETNNVLFCNIPGYKVTGCLINGEDASSIITQRFCSELDLSDYINNDYKIELITEPVGNYNNATFELTGDTNRTEVGFVDAVENVNYKFLIRTGDKVSRSFISDMVRFTVNSYTVEYAGEYKVYCDGTELEKKLTTVNYWGSPFETDYYETSIGTDSKIEIRFEADKVAEGSFTINQEDFAQLKSYTISAPKKSDGTYDLTGLYVVDFEMISDGAHIPAALRSEGNEYATNKYELYKKGTSSADTYYKTSCRVPASELCSSTVGIPGDRKIEMYFVVVAEDGIEITANNGMKSLKVEKGSPSGDGLVEHRIDAHFGDVVNVYANGGKRYAITSISVDDVYGNVKLYRGNSVTVDTTDKSVYYLFVNTTKNYVLDVSGPSIEDGFAKDIYNIEPDMSYTLTLYSGASSTPFTAVLKNGTETVGEYNSIESDNTMTINVPNSYCGRSLSLEVKPEGSSSVVKKYIFKVTSKLASVKLNGKADGSVITQQMGTTVDYNVTFNAGFNPKNVEVDTEFSDGTQDITYDSEKCVLTVASKPYHADEKWKYTDSATVKFKYLDTEKSFTINYSDTAVKNALPTIKLDSATAVALNVSVGVPSSITVADGLFYRIDYNAVDELAAERAGYRKGGSMIYPVGDTAGRIISIPVGNSIEEKDGVPVKYDVNVELFLGKIITPDDNPEAIEFERIVNSKKATISGISTKEPAYATKLTLTKKTATIYADSKEIWYQIAIPKYDTATTYRGIEDYTIVPDDGNVAVDIDDEKGIRVNPGENALGKYKITVVAKGNGAIPVTASVDFTVKNNINPSETTFTTSTSQVYKANKKAASFKTTLTTVDYQGKVLKPKKVVYRLTDTDENPLDVKTAFNGTVSVKANGVVNIARNYIAPVDAADARIKVEAICTLYDNSEINIYSDVVEIVTTPLEIASLQVISNSTLESVTDSVTGKEVYTDDLSDTRIVAFDKNGVEIGDVAYTTSGKSVAIDADGNVTGFGKPGTTKITVTTTDGSNSKKQIELKTKYYAPEAYTLYATLESGSEVEIDKNVTTEIGKSGINDVRITFMKGDNEFDVGDLNAPLVNLTVTPKNLKLVNLTAKNGYYSIAKNSSLTLKTGTKKLAEYNFVDNRYVDNVVRLKATSLNVYATKLGIDNIHQMLTFEFADNSMAQDGYKYTFMPDSTACYQNQTVYDNYEMLMNAIDYNYKAKLGEKKFGYILNGDSSHSMIKGTYKLLLYVTDAEGNLKCNPIKFTVNVKEPAKPVTTLSGIYSVDGSDNKFAIKFTRTTGIKWKVLTVSNNNDKGKINEFNKYFSINAVNPLNNEYEVVLMDDCGVYKIADVPEADRIGWLTIATYDAASNMYESTVKITVKVK